VVCGAMGWLARHDARELTAVAIAPDLGERYLDTIYQTNWFSDLYGEDVLSGSEPIAGPRPVAAFQAPPAGSYRADPPRRSSLLPQRPYRENADI
jgi:N-(2-amino-2-carboxyethyl)-L-glutamate synthase